MYVHVCSQPTLTIYYGQSAFGGNVLMSREFFNPKNGDFIHIEAHELRGQPDDGADGKFMVAFWVPDGNSPPARFMAPMTMEDAIREILACSVPKGMVEMTIPEDAY